MAQNIGVKHLKDGSEGADLYDFSRCLWSVKDVFVVLIYSIALFFVFSFWFVVAARLAAPFGGVGLCDLLDVKGQGIGRLCAIFFYYSVLLITIKVKIFNKYKIKDLELFIRRDQIKSDIFYGVMMYVKFFVVIILSVFLGYLIAAMWDMVFGAGLLDKLNIFFTAAQAEKETLEAGRIGIFGIIILAPFIEEFFFRGCLYRALRARFSRMLAIVVSSFIFSLLHGYFFLFVHVFLIGIILAYMYEKRRSLVAPLTFHMLNNLVVLLFFI